MSDGEFQRAITTNPEYAEARQWYGLHLCVRGRFDEGIHELERAQQLDPLSPMLNVQLGSGYYFARRYERAADILLTTLEIDGAFGPAHWFLGRSMVSRAPSKRRSQNLKWRSRRLIAPPSFSRRSAGRWGSRGGRGSRGRARRASVALRARVRVPNLLRAGARRTWRSADDRRSTLRSAKERSPFAIWTKVDPIFDSCRGDPEFEALVHSLE